MAGGVSAALAAYFVLSLYVLPQSYLDSVRVPKPEPVITGVTLPDSIQLGQTFTLHVTATNRGDHADMQIVSMAFPNLTSTDGVVTVQKHDFKQTPVFIKKGQEIGAGYVGSQRIVTAQYPSVEASNRPWEKGDTSSIELAVTPESEGRFVIFVKAIGLPHNGDQAHWPSDGIIDHQDEFVSVYSVDVTKT
jgi:hypothetical protein